MKPNEQFDLEKIERVKHQSENVELKSTSQEFMFESIKAKYSYNFSWMGRPIIAYPQDMIAMQEIIWEVKPDLIIETGVAHGGSIVYYASLLELIGGDGLVVGIDIDIRKYNREQIEAHSMMKRIHLIEGSSVDKEIIEKVYKIAEGKKKILVCLDSNHTHEHVLNELNVYAKLVSVGSYCVVFDTIVDDIAEDVVWENRDWGKGNNPKTAVMEYLSNNSSFTIDDQISDKLLISVAPRGYLKRVS